MFFCVSGRVVPTEGLEPPPLAAHGPEPCASTNSATWANLYSEECYFSERFEAVNDPMRNGSKEGAATALYRGIFHLDPEATIDPFTALAIQIHRSRFTGNRSCRLIAMPHEKPIEFTLLWPLTRKDLDV